MGSAINRSQVDASQDLLLNRCLILRGVLCVFFFGVFLGGVNFGKHAAGKAVLQIVCFSEFFTMCVLALIKKEY